MGIMTQKRYDPICFSVMATTGTFRSDDIVYVFASIVMISLDLQNTKDCARIQSAQVCHFHIGRHFGIRGTKRRTFRTSTVNYSDVLGYPKFSHEQPREKDGCHIRRAKIDFCLRLLSVLTRPRESNIAIQLNTTPIAVQSICKEAKSTNHWCHTAKE